MIIVLLISFTKVIVSIWGGMACLLIGIAALWLTIKSPELKKSAFRGDIRGWIGGIMLIISGLGILIYKIFF